MKQSINPKLVMLIGLVGLSISSPLGKLAPGAPLITATYRLLWTVVLMIPFVLRKNLGELKQVPKKDLFLCLISGIFLALHFTIWFQSLKMTSVASATALVATEAVFTPIGYWLFLRGRLTRLSVFAIALSFSGSALIAFSDGSGGGSILGDVLAILAAVAFTVHALIGTRMRTHLSATVYTFLVYSSCALFLLVMDFVTGTPLTGWGMKEMVVCFVLAVVCTLMGHSLFSWCLKFLSPAYLATVKLLDPIIASILAYFIFHEIPGPLQILGALIILSGVLIYTRDEERKKPTLVTEKEQS